MKVFMGNFQGTYVYPVNSWDLRSCRQNPNETLHEYIWRFSRQCTELPNVTDADVGAFFAGTTCKELIHELGHKGPHTTKELLDIATNFASREDIATNFASRCGGCDHHPMIRGPSTSSSMGHHTAIQDPSHRRHRHRRRHPSDVRFS
jgi:hypothetical protein